MRKVVNALAVLILFVTLCKLSYAERFSQFLSREGFTQNSAAALLQDSKGFLWIGTPNGLFKYDGYKFEIYRSEVGNKNSLVYNVISGIYESPDGKLWVATNRGISVYNPKTDQFSTIRDVRLEKSRDINFDFEGKVIVGTDFGLMESNLTSIDSLEFREITLENVEQIRGININDIYLTSYGKWLVGTSSGLIIWEPGENPVSPFVGGTTQKLKNWSRIPGALSINQIVEDADGNCWMGSLKGIYSITKDNQISKLTSEKYPNISLLRIKAMALDSHGNLWIGSLRNGLVKYNGNDFEQFVYDINDPTSVGSNHVNALVEDHSGVLWIGTARGGLNKLDLYQKPITHYKRNPFDSNSLSSNLINCIYEDHNENIWVGTFDGGLNLIIKEKGKHRFVHLKEFGIKSIYNITQDSNNVFYCSVSDDGLYKFRWNNGIKDLERIELIDEEGNDYKNISRVIVDSKGIIWFGADGNLPGVIRYAPDSKKERKKVQFYKEGIGTSQTVQIYRVADLFEDSNGDIWVGTSGFGLFKMKLNKETRKPLQIRNIGYEPFEKGVLTSDRVFSITEDKNKAIWVGVFGGGLIKINNPADLQNIQLEYISSKHGLADDAVYGILEDDKGYFWISTNNGISKLDPENRTFVNFDIEDGLQDNNFRRQSYHKGKSGKLYFGGINGLNEFDPDNLNQNPKLPKVVLTDLKIFNKTIKPGVKERGKVILNENISETKDVVLRNSDNSFSLDFAALHYSTPDKNIYKFMLEGADRDWTSISSERRFAAYSNLKSGDYTFKLKAANSDGVWNQTPTELFIRVLPPWWQSIWAYLLYLLITVGALFLFRRYIIVKQVYEGEIKLEKLEKEKIKELNKAKLEFFTNITHEFKTPLTLIIGPISEIFRVADTFPDKIKENLELVNSNANRMLKLINQLIEFRRIEAGHLELKNEKLEIVAFLSEIVKSVSAYGRSRNIHYSVQCDIDKLIVNQDKDKFEKIFYNLLSNAIKYTPDFGLVSVILNVYDQKVKENYAEEVYWVVQNKLERYVEISVSNSGKGIAKEYYPYIFDRFYGGENQQEIEKQHIFKSSGIGLALTKRLVAAFGGEIGVSSKEDETTFVLRFPLQNDAEIHGGENHFEFVKEDQPGLEMPEIEAEETEDPKAKKPIVLIVDDNNEIRKYVRNTFEDRYHIMEAVNGQEAYDMVLRTIPDLIISDVMMPVMDGLEFCKKIKSNDVINHIPIILLTAKTTDENRIEGLEVGADSYIPKPFNIQHLKIRIEKLLELRKTLRDKYINGFQVGEMDSSGMSEGEMKFIKNIETVIDENLMNESFSVEDLGNELAFSRMQLYRKLKALTGYSPNEYIRNYRLKQAAKLLQKRDLNVTEVLYEIGFSNKSYFTKCFKEMYNMTPKEYSKQFERKREI